MNQQSISLQINRQDIEKFAKRNVKQKQEKRDFMQVISLLEEQERNSFNIL